MTERDYARYESVGENSRACKRQSQGLLLEPYTSLSLVGLAQPRNGVAREIIGERCNYSGVGRCFCMEGLHSIMRALSYHTKCCQLLWASPGNFVYALKDQVSCKDI